MKGGTVRNPIGITTLNVNAFSGHYTMYILKILPVSHKFP